MIEPLDLKVFEKYHRIIICGTGNTFHIRAWMRAKWEESFNPDIPPFFFKREIDNAILGQKVYEYLLQYIPVSEEHLEAKKESIKELDTHLLEISAQSEQLTTDRFSKMESILEILAEKKCLNIVPLQRLCSRGTDYITRAEIDFRESVDAKELGYWVKEGIDRCFVRGHYKIPKSKGIRIKYNRKVDPVLPPGTPEGVEVTLPRNNVKFRDKGSSTFYFRNGLVAYHQNIYSEVKECYLVDIYRPYGIFTEDTSDKELGKIIHASLLDLDPYTVPEGERVTKEPYVKEAERIEREIFNELKTRLNIQSDEELFDGVLCCYAVELEKNFLLVPTRRIGFKEFSIMGKKYVVENARCTASELGRALREAFKRCETTPTSELSSVLNYD